MKDYKDLHKLNLLMNSGLKACLDVASRQDPRLNETVVGGLLCIHVATILSETDVVHA